MPGRSWWCGRARFTPHRPTGFQCLVILIKSNLVLCSCVLLSVGLRAAVTRGSNESERERQAGRRTGHQLVDKSEDHPKLFHNFTRGKLTVKDQAVRLKTSEGKFIGTNAGNREELEWCVS